MQQLPCTEMAGHTEVEGTGRSVRKLQGGGSGEGGAGALGKERVCWGGLAHDGGVKIDAQQWAELV